METVVETALIILGVVAVSAISLVIGMAAASLFYKYVAGPMHDHANRVP